MKLEALLAKAIDNFIDRIHTENNAHNQLCQIYLQS